MPNRPELPERSDRTTPLTDWAYQILDQLKGINTKVGSLDEKMDVMDRLLTGNDKPAEGLVVRMDRLEQEAIRRDDETKNRRVWINAFIVSIVGVLVAIAVALVKLAFVAGNLNGIKP